MKGRMLLVGLLFCISGCNGISVPSNYVDIMTTIRLEPDSKKIVISNKVDSLKFSILEEAESYVTCICGSGGGSLVYGDKDVIVSRKEWQKLLDWNKGKEIKIEIYLKKGGVWYKYPVIKNNRFDDVF